MAYAPLSSLLRRSSSSHILRRTPRRLTSSSAAAAAAAAVPSPGDSPKSTLSARMSFVFDQIDAIERERNEKDETLRRIRAWREKKHRADADQSAAAAAEAPAQSPADVAAKENLLLAGKEVELVHPWPEWVEFMELLMRQNYFDHRRRDESRSIPNLVDGGDDDLPDFVEEGIDFTRDFATVRTACVNFGRDRFDILRPLSRKDIQVLVGYGCPSTDPKLIFSAKVLRKYVHLDEGDVCSACSMRNSCNKAYLLTRKEDEARTVDVIRLLLPYGFDPINGAVENKLLMTNKSIKTVIRKLLHEISKLGSVPIDPNLPPPIIKKPPPKIKQPPPPPKKRVGRDDIEMKKGDWLCPKCDFMNFAKNTICLQCDAKRPKRQLLPGEWECPECNFLNYRRNMVCFHCEHKRPPDEYMENKVQEKQSHPGTRLQRLARNPVISDAWNFDFDDNESDGADVAAFEFADSPKADGLYSMDNQSHENGKMQEFQGEDIFVNSQTQGVGEERQYSEPRKRWGPPSVANGTGFDDFDDEDDDDDDVDSYEIDSPDNQSKRESTWSSGSHDFHDDEDSPRMPQRRMPLSDSKYSDSDLDSEGEHSDHSNWKSSHIANGRHKLKSENRRHMGLSFGSDDELGLSSDGDDRYKSSLQDFSEKRDNRRRQSPVRNPRNKHFETKDEVLFDSDSAGDDDLQDHRNRRNNKLRNVSSFRGDSTSAVRNGGFRLNGTREAHNSYGDRNNHGRNGGRSHWNEGSYGEKRRWGRRANERNDDFRGSDRFGRGGRFGRKQRDDFDEFSGRKRMDRERDIGSDRPRRDNFDELSGQNRMDRERDFRRDRPRRGNFDEVSRRNEMNRERDFESDRPRRRIIER